MTKMQPISGKTIETKLLDEHTTISLHYIWEEYDGMITKFRYPAFVTDTGRVIQTVSMTDSQKKRHRVIGSIDRYTAGIIGDPSTKRIQTETIEDVAFGTDSYGKSVYAIAFQNEKVIRMFGSLPCTFQCTIKETHPQTNNVTLHMERATDEQLNERLRIWEHTDELAKQVEQYQKELDYDLRERALAYVKEWSQEQTRKLRKKIESPSSFFGRWLKKPKKEQ